MAASHCEQTVFIVDPQFNLPRRIAFPSVPETTKAMSWLRSTTSSREAIAHQAPVITYHCHRCATPSGLPGMGDSRRSRRRRQAGSGGCSGGSSPATSVLLAMGVERNNCYVGTNARKHPDPLRLCSMMPPNTHLRSWRVCLTLPASPALNPPTGVVQRCRAVR
jgi:hypothetical protein